MSSNYLEEERIQKELEEYVRILEKLREDQNKELSKPKPSRAICLSNLKSPISKSNIELSEDNVKSMLDRVSNLIIRYGRELL